MGLDISIMTDNYEQVMGDDYHTNENDYFNKHSLSRTFAHFMFRRAVVEHEPELEQLGKLAGIDVSPLYDMETYPDEEGIAYFLETAEDDEERAAILADAEADKQKLANNIDAIILLINTLIEKLAVIDNVPALLLPTEFDSLSNASYFADFNADKGEGYIDNNFGQDLRNFSRFLDFAKERGATTVWFDYY